MTASRSASSQGSERSSTRRNTASAGDLEPRVATAVLHGHRVSYRTAGEGPVILLIHGITGDSRQWNEVIPQLADHYTVLAPTCWAMVSPPSHAATTPWARTRSASATC